MPNLKSQIDALKNERIEALHIAETASQYPGMVGEVDAWVVVERSISYAVALTLEAAKKSIYPCGRGCETEMPCSDLTMSELDTLSDELTGKV